VAPANPWRADWALAWMPGAACDTLLTREALFRSSTLPLSEALARESHLGLLSSGCTGALDLPYTISPGIERLSSWLDGAPTAGGAIPEAMLQTLSPLGLQEMLRLAPDPFLDPLGASRDGMLCGRSLDLAGATPLSAVRLTQGPGGAATEDFLLGRQGAQTRWWGAYAHSRSDGRPVFIHPRYSLTGFQNLALHYDRDAPYGPAGADVSDRAGRLVLEGIGKLVWQAQRLSGAWQLTPGDSLAGELRLTRRVDRLLWFRPSGETIRRTISNEALLRATIHRGRATLLFAAGGERVSLHYREPGHAGEDGAHTGLGVAMGGVLRGREGVVHATVGWTAPWWGSAHGRAHIVGSAPLGPRMSAEAEAWAGSDAAFVPRLEGDENALLEEGVVLPGSLAARTAPLRRVVHGELRLRARAGAQQASAAFFARRLTRAIGVDPADAAGLAPGERDALGYAALAGSVTLTGGRVAWKIALPLGGRLDGEANLLLSPGRARLPVLTARESGRVSLSFARALFQGDLLAEVRLVGQWRGRWLTPYGERPALARWDAEIHGTKGPAHFFFALRHLANGAQDSGTYGEGEWMPLPFRSSQIGIEWHFAD
jgi:hypothetical protein